MRKRVGVEIQTSRVKPVGRQLDTKRKLTQDKFGAPAVGLPTTDLDSTTGNSSTVNGALPVEPASGDTVDSIGSGQTVTELLTASAGVYCPTFPVIFYRRVWFNGLEAFNPYHYTVSGGCVVPNTTLSSPNRVTASYVKA